jgi:predicted transcriptional regulator of viral defense system
MWSVVVDRVVHRARGLPAALARVPFGVLRPLDAARVYAHPRPEFRRLVDGGVLHRLATGYYAVVPAAAHDRRWVPSLEASAFGIAAADYGPEAVALMGLSAARLHGGVPRGLGVSVVAVPKQRPPVRLLDREATVVFVRRSVDRLEVEASRSDLGRVMVTTIEQTVLDLAHRPALGGIPGEARAAVAALWPCADVPELRRLAGEQRLRAAADRAADWAGR